MKSKSWLAIVITVTAASFPLLVSACTKDAESARVESSVSAASSAAPAPALAGRGTERAATPVGQPPPAPVPGVASPAVEPAGPGQPEQGNDPVPADSSKKDKSYSVKVDAPASVAPGAAGKVRISVTPSKGWKMNKEFPTKLEVTAPDGVTVTGGKQAVKDAERFDDQGATFVVEFKADAAGQKSFNADFKFAVCTDATCDPKREKLAWVVDVK